MDWRYAPALLKSSNGAVSAVHGPRRCPLSYAAVEVRFQRSLRAFTRNGEVISIRGGARRMRADARNPAAKRSGTRTSSVCLERSARQQHGVDHMDHAVRLQYVTDGDGRGAALRIDDGELAGRRLLDGDLAARNRLELGF